MIFACIIASVGLSIAQTTRATGLILDDTGETVIGASVVAKGTTVGTVTGIDGTFSLNVPSNAKMLVISLIGYKKQEVKVGTDLKIVMEPDSELIDEVVVTAMGITREKKALGYASQGIKAEELVQANNTSLSGALQGKVSGVQITPSSGMPGASSQIVIRGARSFKDSNTPLYVIDGMPVSSTADIETTGYGVTGADYADRGVDIDPSDIESIEILKGQAASALYGIRASNGVVIITTKSGKNLQKGKPQITVNTSLSFEKPTRYPKMQTLYAQGSGGKFNPNASSAWGPLISELPNDPTYGGNTDNKYTTEYGKHEGKYYVPQRAAAGLDPWVTPQAYDNIKNFFDTGVTWNTSVNIAQALEKSSYSLFLGSVTQDGIIPSTGMDRYTAKLSAETKLTNQWTTGFVGTYVNSKITKAPSANSGILATVYGAPPSYDLNGIPGHISGDPYTQNHYRGGSFENPYWAIDNNEFSEKTSRFYGNAYMNYSTNLNSSDKKMNIKYQIGTDAYITDYVDQYGYGSRNHATGNILLSSWNDVTFNSLLTANFNWTINQDWSLNVIAGNEVVHNSREYKWQRGTNLSFSGWNHIKNATVFTSSQDLRSKRSVGFFGNADVSFRNMLYIGVTGRQDIVSYMPRDNRTFFYPSINASFILTELEQFKTQSVLTFAKVRASYAQVGQAGDYRANYYYKPTFSGGFYSGNPIQYPINGVNGLRLYPTIFDPNLKPQNTVSYEGGLDLTFLNGLVDFSYTYSRQNVKDQIFEVPLPSSTGFDEILTNGGKIHTNVHEVSLNVNPIRKKTIDWSFGLNFSKIDNYVDELADGVDNIFLGGFSVPQIRAGIGDKFPVIYGVDFKRDQQGRILVDEDGYPMAGEQAVIGSVSPDFNLGFHTNLRFGKLSVSAVFDWKQGGEMYHGTNGLLSVYGVGKMTENRTDPIVFDGWKEDGTKNDIEIPVSQLADYYSWLNSIHKTSVFGTSFIKLRELSVNYIAYKKSWLEVGVTAFARNILIWTELENFDPESSQGNNNMSGGFERFSMPQTSSYGFGLNVKF